jgi:hypothetical protein
MQAAIGVAAPFPGFVQPDEAKALHSPQQRLDQELQARSPMTPS